MNTPVPPDEQASSYTADYSQVLEGLEAGARDLGGGGDLVEGHAAAKALVTDETTG